MTFLQITTGQNIWTIIETYSFVQGIVLASYATLILKRYYLGSLLLIISILIFSHLFYLYEWFFTIPHAIFLEAPLWYLIGPLFYTFTQRLYGRKFRPVDLLHLLPFMVFTGYLFPFYLQGATVKIEAFTSLYTASNLQVDWNRYLFSSHILIYVLISFVTFRKKEWQLRQTSAATHLIFSDLASTALKYYLIFSLLGLLIYPFISTNYELTFSYYSIYYVGLSIFIHLTFFYSLFTPAKNEQIEPTPSDRKYHSSSLSHEEMALIVHQVKAHVQQHNVYKNPDLRLRMVADELDIPVHHISQAVNQVTQKTFFDLINEVRIEGLKTNINQPEFRNYTLTGIASEHGFKSSSSFYRIFKKYTGKTPKAYFKK